MSLVVLACLVLGVAYGVVLAFAGRVAARELRRDRQRWEDQQ